MRIENKEKKRKKLELKAKKLRKMKGNLTLEERVTILEEMIFGKPL